MLKYSVIFNVSKISDFKTIKSSSSGNWYFFFKIFWHSVKLRAEVSTSSRFPPFSLGETGIEFGPIRVLAAYPLLIFINFSDSILTEENSILKLFPIITWARGKL